MGHALLNGVYDWQGGTRGDKKAFVAGMVMGSARRDLGENGRLQLRAMLSPDPLMGKAGYPLHLAAGESADGLQTLVDRQHPHELVMELSASFSRRLSDSDSLFLYAGLPGEPAFGPPAFMHRLSAMDSPEAPITHHWLDSTHIVFGVVTAGFVHDRWKAEVSRFKGREPDEDRYDIENPKLDSTAARLSWNPTDNASLQASFAKLKSPEQLDPEVDVRKYSLSAIHTAPIGRDGWWSATVGWGRKRVPLEDLTFDAWTVEAAVKPNASWTFFGRGERANTDELLFETHFHQDGRPHRHHGPPYWVSKISAGVVRDFRLNARASLGIGALYALNFVPGDLEPSYGGDPRGAMAFVRLKLN